MCSELFVVTTVVKVEFGGVDSFFNTIVLE